MRPERRSLSRLQGAAVRRHGSSPREARKRGWEPCSHSGCGPRPQAHQDSMPRSSSSSSSSSGKHAYCKSSKGLETHPHELAGSKTALAGCDGACTERVDQARHSVDLGGEVGDVVRVVRILDEPQVAAACCATTCLKTSRHKQPVHQGTWWRTAYECCRWAGRRRSSSCGSRAGCPSPSCRICSAGRSAPLSSSKGTGPEAGRRRARRANP